MCQQGSSCSYRAVQLGSSPPAAGYCPSSGPPFPLTLPCLTVLPYLCVNSNHKLTFTDLFNPGNLQEKKPRTPDNCETVYLKKKKKIAHFACPGKIFCSGRVIHCEHTTPYIHPFMASLAMHHVENQKGTNILEQKYRPIGL